MTLNKRQRENLKEAELKFRRLLTDVIRILGVMFLTGFAMMGAIIYFIYTQPYTNVMVNVLTAVCSVMMLYFMSQVTEDW